MMTSDSEDCASPAIQRRIDRNLPAAFGCPFKFVPGVVEELPPAENCNSRVVIELVCVPKCSSGWLYSMEARKALKVGRIVAVSPGVAIVIGSIRATGPSFLSGGEH
jgi:hypothetical protein